ncbi:GntR family transcriptional regulator [Maritalea porphyrae]|uniref:GntR family transcriptional regulator n=1 Tax=Maritalea porphyrae TaxID=880732 RepID=UPI0022AF8F2A|nr:GntR family transcriptional regulator [Maritalea porphyrae]MCZ4273180.1 GntR family transcriptional regulator [Maritalea porphyrae]
MTKIDEKPTDRNSLFLHANNREKGVTTQEHIYAQLRDAIMLGRFRPGMSVTIRGLAELLKTSPTPVREALRRLSSENGLELLPNRRIVVPRMTAERLEELIETRVELERFSAVRALPFINDRLIDELEVIDARIDKAVLAGDRDKQIRDNQLFHRTIYCANPDNIRMPMVESVWLQLGPFLRIALREMGDFYKIDRHKEAIAALRARDPKLLRAAIEADVRDGVGQLGHDAVATILSEG